MPNDVISAEAAHQRLNEIDGKIEYLKSRIEGITDIKTALGIMTHRFEDMKSTFEKVDKLDEKFDQMAVDHAKFLGLLEGREKGSKEERERDKNSLLKRLIPDTPKEFAAVGLLLISIITGQVKIGSIDDVRDAIKILPDPIAQVEQVDAEDSEEETVFPVDSPVGLAVEE